ncbi:MAG: Mov34/MPN/PAD-1 family protein [Candidatus Pacearchaeota archaeon]
MIEVILSKVALDEMIISATEVYKKEVYGLLFGRRENFGRKVIIHHAISSQKANRKYKEVIANDKRIAELARELALKVVGDYHSHTDFKGPALNELSEQDKKDLIEKIEKYGNYFVSFLISIRKSKAKKTLYFKDNKIEQIIDIPYESDIRRVRLTIRGYYYNPLQKKEDKVLINPDRELLDFIALYKKEMQKIQVRKMHG